MTAEHLGWCTGKKGRWTVVRIILCEPALDLGEKLWGNLITCLAVNGPENTSLVVILKKRKRGLIILLQPLCKGFLDIRSV